MLVIGSRMRTQAPPPRIVWQALAEPRRDGTRPWLDLVEGEVEPRIIAAEEPSLVVWSSLWPDRPDDILRFDLEVASCGTALRWTLESPGPEPDASRTRDLRYRINYLINGRLRETWDQ